MIPNSFKIDFLWLFSRWVSELKKSDKKMPWYMYFDLMNSAFHLNCFRASYDIIETGSHLLSMIACWNMHLWRVALEGDPADAYDLVSQGPHTICILLGNMKLVCPFNSSFVTFYNCYLIFKWKVCHSLFRSRCYCHAFLTIIYLIFLR